MSKLALLDSGRRSIQNDGRRFQRAGQDVIKLQRVTNELRNRYQTNKTELAQQKALPKLYFSEDIERLLGKSKFSKALELSESLQVSEKDSWARISKLLLLTECEIMSGVHFSAVLHLEELKRIFSRENPHPDDIVREAEVYSRERNYTRAFILFYSAAELYRLNSAVREPLKCLKRIEYCVRGVENMAKEWLLCNRQWRGVVAGHFIPVTVKMVEGQRDIIRDGDTLALSQGMCMHCISQLHRICDNYVREAFVCQQGIDTLQRLLGERSKDYQLFGTLLHNAGAANGYGNVKVAKQYFRRALTAFNSARDWSSLDAKRKTLRITEQCLQELRYRR